MHGIDRANGSNLPFLFPQLISSVHEKLGTCISAVKNVLQCFMLDAAETLLTNVLLLFDDRIAMN